MATQVEISSEPKPRAEMTGSELSATANRSTTSIRNGLIALAITAVLAVASIFALDRQVAILAAKLHLYGLFSASALQSPILVSAAVIAVVIGGVSASVQPRLAPTIKALIEAAMLSGLAMSWGLCLTELLLKPIFGRAIPQLLLRKGAYGFYWLQVGEAFRSFPSGHAVQITSVAAVLWILYPRWRPLYVLAVAAVFVALILGEWHFVSDLLAGSMIGVSGGVLVTRAWLNRSGPRPQ